MATKEIPGDVTIVLGGQRYKISLLGGDAASMWLHTFRDTFEKLRAAQEQRSHNPESDPEFRGKLVWLLAAYDRRFETENLTEALTSELFTGIETIATLTAQFINP